MNLRIFGLLFVGLLILLTAGSLYLRPAAPANLAVEQTRATSRTSKSMQRDATTRNTDSTPDSFYQTIIDNNIFHPLGWQPPRKQPDYTLIGTTVSQNSADSKAFILERRSNRMHIVKVGDTLDDARVKEIQSKRVTLHEAGKDIVLHGGRLQFF